MSILKRLLVGAAAGAAVLAMAAQSSATALIVGSGWQYDQVNKVGTPSENSALTFNVPTGDVYVFSLSDGFKPGDAYTVSFSGLTAFTTFSVYPTTFNNDLGPAAGYFAADWLDSSFSHLQLFFSAGSYSLTVEGNCGGGCAAGVGERLDPFSGSPTPEPATWLSMLLGFGGLGMAARSARRKPALTA
ncbi:MAG TPA: PEP-CTERM sorting domain-containing protein [Caulobacteraceae bacterium]|nr:PEP-CTERM sorting domain-containing protein [Caulobacteraceae bacterium]